MASRNQGVLLVVLLASVLPLSVLHGWRVARRAIVAGVELTRCREPCNRYLVRAQ